MLTPPCWNCIRSGLGDIEGRKSCWKGLEKATLVVELLVESARLKMAALADGKIGVARSRPGLGAVVQLAGHDEEMLSCPAIADEAMVSNNKKVIHVRPVEVDDL